MASSDPPPGHVRHLPSAILWAFCMQRLRELRGEDARERELANILGFEHARAVRWKHGQMYVDRTEHVLRLADALEVPPMVLVHLAAGDIGIEQAQAALKAPADAEGKREKKAAPPPEEAPSVLLVAPGSEEAAFRRVLARSTLAPLVGEKLVDGIVLAERHRPELVFLDASVAGPTVFEACRLLSSLMAMSGLGCRVVVGVRAGTEGLTIEAAAFAMVGAALVTSVPFEEELMTAEVAHAGERLGRLRTSLLLVRRLQMLANPPTTLAARVGPWLVRYPRAGPSFALAMNSGATIVRWPRISATARTASWDGRTNF